MWDGLISEQVLQKKLCLWLFKEEKIEWSVVCEIACWRNECEILCVEEISVIVEENRKVFYYYFLKQSLKEYILLEMS